MATITLVDQRGAIPGMLFGIEDGDVIELDESAYFPYTVIKLTHRIQTGTSIDAVVQIDGTDITGLDGPVTITTTQGTATATAANSVAVNQRLSIEFSNLVGSPDGIAFTLAIQRA